MRKFGLTTLVMALALVAAVCSPYSYASSDDPIILRLSHTGISGTDDLYTLYAEKFAKLVNEKTDGKLKIRIYGSGELYDSFTDATMAVAHGVLDLTVTSVSGAYPLLGVDEANIASAIRLFDSDEKYREFIGSDIYKKLRPLLKKRGVTELDVFAVGKQYIYTRQEISGLEDLQGLKIRGGGKGTRRFLDAIGAVAINMDIGETYGAIQQGVLDGLVTGIDAYVTRNLQEVAPYVTASNFMVSMYPMSLIASNKTWNSLPKSLRETVVDEVIPELHQFANDTVSGVWEKAYRIVDEEAKWAKLPASDVEKLDEAVQTKVFPMYRGISQTGDVMLAGARETAN